MVSISNISVQLQSVSNLATQETTLENLNSQLASGTLHDNLTDYTPTDAKNIMDFQNSITQNQGYITGMQTVSTRLDLYNTTMTDMESIAANAQNLASSNLNQSSSSLQGLQSEAQSYLQQLTSDLNQQVGGRYIYAGTRYTTPPVGDLASSTAPGGTFTPTTSPALPSYDSQYTALTINNAPTGSVQIGNDSISWSSIESGNVTSVDVNGTPTTVTVSGLTSPATTPAEIASNLQSVLGQVSSQIPSLTGISATVSGTTVGITSTSAALSVTADAGGAAGETTWQDGTDGTAAEAIPNSAGSSTADSVAIDSATSVTYGVTSTNPAIQQLIAGLQLISAATQSGVSSSTYTTDMAQAGTLLSGALTGIQALNTNVASNQNLLASESSTQSADITNLQDQLHNIEAVDVTAVGTEIDALQSQLQASYSAVAAIEQLSILKYL